MRSLLATLTASLLTGCPEPAATLGDLQDRRLGVLILAEDPASVAVGYAPLGRECPTVDESSLRATFGGSALHFAGAVRNESGSSGVVTCALGFETMGLPAPQDGLVEVADSSL